MEDNKFSLRSESVISGTFAQAGKFEIGFLKFYLLICLSCKVPGYLIIACNAH